MSTTYLSPERHEELTKELEELRTKGRREVADRLKHAKDLGDLSENFEYQEAREEQSRLEQRISQIEEVLRGSVLIHKTAGSASVRIGSKVKVRRGKEILSFSIVGSHEAKPGEGLISNESPLGRGLLGKKIGDAADVRTPKGSVVYEVLEIE